MPSKEKNKLKKPEGFHCFGCGTANPIGLNMDFYRSADKIYSDVNKLIAFQLLDSVQSVGQKASVKARTGMRARFLPVEHRNLSAEGTDLS